MPEENDILITLQDLDRLTQLLRQSNLPSCDGTALLGLRIGQSIDWPMPNGHQRRLKVLSVIYQPEANEKWLL